MRSDEGSCNRARLPGRSFVEGRAHRRWAPNRFIRDRQVLDDQICELYSSYYEFDSHDQPCWFNEEKEKADKPRMLELLRKLNARIAELNDGSFVVDDQETPRVEAL